MAATKKSKKTRVTRKRPVKRTTKQRPISHVSRTKKTTKKLEGFSDLLSRLEVEAEKITKRLIERAEQVSTELRQSIEDLVDRVRTNGIYSIASDKKDDFEREARRLVEEVIERAKEVELLPLNAANRDRIIREAKKNLEEIRNRINAMEWFARARVSAINTKATVLSILSIPSQSELVKLQKKIANLEKRVNSLHKKAA